MSRSRRPSAPRVRLACLFVCISLLMRASGSPAATTQGGGVAADASAHQTGAPAETSPTSMKRDAAPRTAAAHPARPSKRRRCPPHNPRCNDDMTAKESRPTPTSTPAHGPRSQAGSREASWRARQTVTARRHLGGHERRATLRHRAARRVLGGGTDTGLGLAHAPLRPARNGLLLRCPRARGLLPVVFAK